MVVLIRVICCVFFILSAQLAYSEANLIYAASAGVLLSDTYRRLIGVSWTFVYFWGHLICNFVEEQIVVKSLLKADPFRLFNFEAFLNEFLGNCTDRMVKGGAL